ncbi:MAG: GNAT family N-acetyltransferase [Lewinella sp.]|nr:GNAT family N-acetyltransferase [Lewinella sp.]
MPDGEFILETERLLLQKFTPAHAGFVLQLLNSPAYLKYIGDKGIRTETDARKYIIGGPMLAMEQYGYGFSVACLKNGQIPIGGCGLINREGLSGPDIGFAFLPEYIGKGYGFEIASATLDYAKHELQLRKVLGITLPTNLPSISLLKKIGLEYEQMLRLPGDKQEVMLFGKQL